MSEQNKTLIRRGNEALNAHDLDAESECFTADFVYHARDGDLDWPGYRQSLEAVLRAFPDLHVTVEDMIAERDKVAVRYTVRGTHRGEFLGVAPTAKKVSFRAPNKKHSTF